MIDDNQINNLSNELDNAKTIKSLSNSLDKINNAFNKSCNTLFRDIFNYQLSIYLYKEYILLNKTKTEIAKDLNLSPSTVYYYINKFKLKKSKEMINKKIVESLKKTCNEKYNVDHPGELSDAHVKRLQTILNKSNGDYSKNFYEKLNRSEETKNKMKLAQQKRRQREKIERGE